MSKRARWSSGEPARSLVAPADVWAVVLMVVLVCLALAMLAVAWWHPPQFEWYPLPAGTPT